MHTPRISADLEDKRTLINIRVTKLEYEIVTFNFSDCKIKALPQMEQSRYAHISRSLHFHRKFADNVCIYWKYLYFNMNFAVMIKKKANSKKASRLMWLTANSQVAVLRNFKSI